MRVAVIGAGALGGLLAHRLVRSGAECAVLARGAVLAAIRERGLRVEGEGVSRPRASDDAGDLGPADLVIFAVKAQQLGEAIDAAGPLMAEGGAALPLQNGVAAPQMLTDAFGRERALIGVARIAAETLAPGEVGRVVDAGGVSVGDLDGRQDTGAAARARAVLEAAGVASPLVGDMRAEMWSKFVLASAMGVTAAARCDGRTAARDPRLRALFMAVAGETVEAGLALGAPARPEMAADAAAALDAMPAGVRASMLVDLEAGRPLELDFLCGAAARMADGAGVSAPACAAVAAVMAPWIDGRRTA